MNNEEAISRALELAQGVVDAHQVGNPPPLPQGLRAGPLTEADVRRIVREELARDLEERKAKMRAFVAEVHGSDQAEPITDSRCEYLFWPTGRCDKCGNVHNGKLPGVELG